MADKKLNKLEDVEQELKKNTTLEDIQARRTKRKQMQEAQKQRQELLREYGRILILPLIAIVLTIVIVILDPQRKSEEKPSVTESSAVEQTDEAASEDSTEETTEPETTQDPTIVREYFDNTLEDFFASYFDARLNADTDKLYAMTGASADDYTEAQTSSLRKQLKTQAGYIESYGNIHLYAVNGLEQYAKLVFVTYDVKFRRVDTAAPGIMYCYIRVNDADSYEIVENMQPDQVKFVNDYVTNHEEVRALIDQADSKLLQALSSDQRLAVVYDAFMTGRIYSEDQSVIDSEVSLIETSAAETAAETEAESSAQETETVTESSVQETETAAAETDTQ